MANRLLTQTQFMWLLKKAYKLYHHKPFSFQVCNWSVINIRLDHLWFIIQMSLSYSKSQKILRKGSSAPCWFLLQAEFSQGKNLGMKSFDAKIPPSWERKWGFEWDILHFLNKAHCSKERLMFPPLLFLAFNRASHIRLDDISVALFPITNGVWQNYEGFNMSSSM